MPGEWTAVCKDCGTTFTYSDFVHRQRLRRGLSAPERCTEHRQRHAVETREMASSHFGLSPAARPSLLGSPFLGAFDRADRGQPVLGEVAADSSGMDLGLGDDQIAEIYEALEHNKVLVVVAPTGAGKSTMIPFRLLSPPEESGLSPDHFTPQGRRIVVTQPRRDATSDIPETIASKLHGSRVGPGSEIGFRHSQHRDRTDPWNRLVFVTDGTLANWLTEQRAGEFSIIVVDEAHERSTTIDLILGLLRSELLRHPELKLIILSATIHADSFVRFFEEVLPKRVWLRDFAECEKTHGYTVQWPPGDRAVEADEMIEAIADKVVDLLRSTGEGAILAFLPGKDEIAAAIDSVNRKLDGKLRQNTAVLPLHAALSNEERARATGAPGKKGSAKRRVVIATNVAETSLTIPDIAYVVDSGLIKQSVWDPASRTDSLPTRWHSQAGCRQRWGRAGRNQPGTVFPLYTQKQFEGFEAHTAPAAVRERLDDVFVSAKRAGISSLAGFAWLDSPPEPEISRLERLASGRGYVDAEGDLTQRGSEVFDLYRRIGAFLGEGKGAATRGLDMAALLMLADRYACLVEAATLIVLLDRMGERLYNPKAGLLCFDSTWPLEEIDRVERIQSSLRAGCRDDLDLGLKLVALYQGGEALDGCLTGGPWAEHVRLNIPSLVQAIEDRDQILRAFNEKLPEPIRNVHPPYFERLRLIAAAAWPDLAVELAGGGRWRGPDGEEGAISRHSVLAASTGGGEAAVAAYARREPDEEGKYSGSPVAGVLVRIARTNATGDEPRLAKAVRSLRSETDEARQRLFADALQPVGSRVPGGEVFRWTTGTDGLPVSEVAPVVRSSTRTWDGRTQVGIRFERTILHPRTGEPTGLAGTADGACILVDVADLSMAGAIWPAAFLNGMETELDVIRPAPGVAMLSLLPRLEEDWARQVVAAELVGTVVAAEERTIEIHVQAPGLRQARHSVVCNWPRQREHLPGLGPGSRVWLRVRPPEENGSRWTLRADEASEVLKAGPEEARAAERVGIVLTDGELRVDRRLSVADFYKGLAAAPSLRSPIRNLFRRCHLLRGIPDTLETEASLRCARDLLLQAKGIWADAWTKTGREVRNAVIAFRPTLKATPVSGANARLLREVLDEAWEIAAARSASDDAGEKRAWVARRRMSSDRLIAALLANIAKNQADIGTARTSAFVTRASAWIAEDVRKLAAARQTRAGEEALWLKALREADGLETAAHAAKARLDQLKRREWPV